MIDDQLLDSIRRLCDDLRAENKRLSESECRLFAACEFALPFVPSGSTGTVKNAISLASVAAKEGRRVTT